MIHPKMREGRERQQARMTMDDPAGKGKEKVVVVVMIVVDVYMQDRTSRCLFLLLFD